MVKKSKAKRTKKKQTRKAKKKKEVQDNFLVFEGRQVFSSSIIFSIS